jgi:hypothetical protein
MGSLRVINELEFRDAFEAYDKCCYKERVTRAMSWFRKGINEENFIDEFIAYWTGLEVISDVILKSHQLSFTQKPLFKKIVTKIRKVCKMTNVSNDKWAGIRRVYENELKFTNFNQIKKARNGLLHGFRHLDQAFINEIQGYVEPTRKTVLACISSILTLNHETRKLIENKKMRAIRKYPWIEIIAGLENPPTTLEEASHNFPRVEAKIKNIEYKINTKGEIEISNNIQYKYLGPEDSKWNKIIYQSWGDENSGISEGKIEMKE